MKPEWSTPPNGDFAAYVEQLTAQAARRALHTHHELEEGAPVAHEASVLAHPEPSRVAHRYTTTSAPPVQPGQQVGSDHPLARGLLAALGALRERLERSLPVPPKKY
jgi:hypothetical protein